MTEIANKNVGEIVKRIMEVAEGRVGSEKVDYGAWAQASLERIAPIMPVRPLMEFFLYGDRINYTDPDGRELLRGGKLLDTRLLQECKWSRLYSHSIWVGRVIYPVTRVEGRRGIERAQLEHRRAVEEARRRSDPGAKDSRSIGELNFRIRRR